MELKDVILSTLAEMEEPPVEQKSIQNADFEVKEIKKAEKPLESFKEALQEQTPSNPESELMFLNSIRERLLVLFEGFQAPNNTNIEAKVDLTLNFLEYVLATIDTRVEQLDKGKKS